MVFASICMRACKQCLFLRARAFDKFFLRAASSFEITDGEHRALSSTSSYFVNFPLAGISLLLIGNVVLRQVIVHNRAETSKSEQYRCKPRAAQPIPEARSQLCTAWCQITSRTFMWVNEWTLKDSKNFKSCSESCQGNLLPKPYLFNPTLVFLVI